MDLSLGKNGRWEVNRESRHPENGWRKDGMKTIMGRLCEEILGKIGRGLGMRANG